LSKEYFIAASILSADFAELGNQISTAEAAGADWIHVDIMDGHFVPNLTMGPMIVKACRSVTQLPLDVHLMIQAPERMIEAFAEAGADRLTVHIEASQHIHRLIQNIGQLGAAAGIALNPGTPALMVEPVLHMVDLVLAMTVNPGFGGQAFLPEVLPKITDIRRMLDDRNPNAVIQVDGGITSSTLPQTLKAGAQSFVAGYAVFKHPAGIAEGVGALKRACSY
jgi:ribulose-phosphate 3-epimerase